MYYSFSITSAWEVFFRNWNVLWSSRLHLVGSREAVQWQQHSYIVKASEDTLDQAGRCCRIHVQSSEQRRRSICFYQAHHCWFVISLSLSHLFPILSLMIDCRLEHGHDDIMTVGVDVTQLSYWNPKMLSSTSERQLDMSGANDRTIWKMAIWFPNPTAGTRG